MKSPRSSLAHSLDRQGATLTEVLMAMLIMSIGVLSVITLFPLAILRAVQASQMTNAKILQLNVEEIVRTNRDLLLDRSSIDPVVGSPAFPPPSTQTAVTAARVIDPLGSIYMTGVAGYFGNNNGTTGVNLPSGNPALVRLNPLRQPGLAHPINFTEQEIDALFTLPDSWIPQFEEIPVRVEELDLDTMAPGPEAMEVELPQTLDLAASFPSGSRLVVISGDGTRSLVRSVVPADYNNTTKVFRINYSVTSPQFPVNLNELGAAEVGSVRLESPERRYSWLMTIPENKVESIKPLPTCVIFFRRSFENESEQVYTISPALTRNATSATVTWSSPTQDPLLKIGGHVFDAENAYWYQITSVTSGTGTATIEFEPPLVMSTATLLFPLGIVHKFELSQ